MLQRSLSTLGLAIILSGLLSCGSPAGMEENAAQNTSQSATVQGPWWSDLSQGVATQNPANIQAVFGPGADTQWTITGDATFTPDALMGRPSLQANKTVTIEGQTKLVGPKTLTGWVKLGENDGKSSQVIFRVGKQDAKDPGISLALVGNPGTQAVTANLASQGKPIHNNAEMAQKLDWVPAWPSNFTYKLKAYNAAMPGWDEDFRVRVEHDMSQLPGLKDKWVQVRIQTAPNTVSVYVDDRLVATRTAPNLVTEGTAQIVVNAGAQLADFSVQTGQQTPGYLTVGLIGYANAKNFIDGQPIDWSTLPRPGTAVDVQGVPFVFSGVNPEGNDHIDIGRSYMRQANAMGYLASTTPRLGGAHERDPVRIQLRIPNANYKALHLIAASDNEADSTPVITAQFYRPGVGFHENFSGKVPLATATASGDNVKPLGAKLVNGKHVNLYLVTIPLDPGMLSSLSDLNLIEVELTKEVQLWRSYPDPISYAHHQAGLPSAAHVYAMTLQETPVSFAWQPDIFGHVWTAGQTPGYTATLVNQTATPRKGKLTVTTKSYDGTETSTVERPVNLPARPTPVPIKVPLPVKLNGYFDVTATLTLDATDNTPAESWTEKRSMTKLAADTRSAKWTEGRGTLFGYWSYHGGHYTPKAEHHVRLMTLAGARVTLGAMNPDRLPPEVAAMVRKHWAPAQAGAWEVSPQAWAATEPLDPEKSKAFQEDVIKKFKEHRAKIDPEFLPDHVYFYPEPHISSRLTAGNVPDYWQGKPFELTEAEQTRLRIFFNTSKLAAEAVRKELPGLKILIPWGDPGFSWPLLRAGFPKELIDGTGIDIPGFERIPERQLHEQSLHRLYVTRKEFERAGIPNPQLQFCEGIFVPTEPGAVTWREQMDIYHRFSLLSMAYGVDRFYSAWFAFDCGSYYGAEHYGGCGIQRRIPYCDPKPAYAAYATMTDKLNEANFKGWLKTGSLTNYALHFQGPKGNVYPLWNIRGKRAVTLALSENVSVNLTDSMNNTKTLTPTDNKVTVVTDPSVVYITLAKPTASVVSVQVQEPDNSDAQPPADARPLADLADGNWKFTNETDKLLENNHWAMMHYPGKFSATVKTDPTHGKVLESKLLKQDREHQLMPWYNTLKPAAPVAIPGAPSHLGLWVKGNSDWGRFIYVLKDAKGERWYSIGEKDQYNCDDVHSWSQFNFDGWRYLTFETPGHTGWDSYRKNGSTWWRFTEEGIVDLPLTLETVIVQQRSHILYVNDIQPAASDTVQLGKLMVHYEKPFDATEEAVRESRLRMPRPQGTPELPNPITKLAGEGTLPATKIEKLVEPTHYYDGTRMHVHFTEVPEAVKYYLYCGPYEDGRGAVNMVPAGIKNTSLVRGLRPGVPLYYWIVWEDKDKKLSKPSPVFTMTTVDNFKEK